MSEVAAPGRGVLPLPILIGCLAALMTLSMAAGVAVGPAGAEAATRPPLELGPIRVATKRAPLSVAVNAGRGARLTLRANGKRVHEPFRYAGHRLHVAELSAGDGLHPGHNKISVRATAHGGETATSRSVRVPRWALLADAGEDVGATVGALSRLGTDGGVGSGGKQVRHRWSVTDSPEGADYVLRKRDERRPIFRPDSPGTYELRMQSKVSGGPTSFDQITVPASAPGAPIGTPVNTLDNGKITVGGQSYGGGALSYLVLERATSAYVTAGSAAMTSDGIRALKGVADTYGGDNRLHYLMFISGPTGVAESLLGDFAGIAKQIGADVFTPQEFALLKQSRPFSIVGIPGAAGGAATVRIANGDGVSGAITGYLQKNRATEISGSYVYDLFSPDHPRYDTRTPAGSATSNEMRIGSTTVAATLPAYAKAAFHVVVLNSLTLDVLSNNLFITNLKDASADRGWQNAIAPVLKERMNSSGTPLVLVQTIGNPKAAGSEWNPIVDQLVTRLGANRQLLNALDGTTEYALVGRVGSDAPPAEASTAYDHGPYPAPANTPARLLGLLSRSHTSSFEPTSTNIPTSQQDDGGVNLALLETAYQPLQAWPDLATLPGVASAAEATAAEHDICTRLNFCQAVASCSEVRICYAEKPGANWTGLRSDIATMAYRTTTSFSEATFLAVRNQLSTEIKAVSDVYDYFDRLGAPLVRAEGRSAVDLQAISGSIYDSLQRPAGSAGADGLGIVSAIAGVFALFEGPVGSMGSGIAAVLAFGSAFSDDQGQPILGDEVKSRASELGEALFRRTDLARQEMTGLARLLVSDYGKLTTASQHMASDWSLPGRNDDGPALARLRFASQQWFYEALVPVAYPYLIQASPGTNARTLNCPINSSSRTEAWPNQPDDAQMGAIARYGDDGQPVQAILFFTRGILGGSSPPSGLADKIFKPSTGSSPGAGVEKMRFFTPSVFNGRIVHAVNDHPWCGAAWLPNFP